MKLWEAFIEDYYDEIQSWPLDLTLELFWTYCNGGIECSEKELKIATAKGRLFRITKSRTMDRLEMEKEQNDKPL